MIAAKVANALALDYPRERLEVIVACDGSPDATAERGPGGRRGRRARAAARRQDPRAGPGGRAGDAATIVAFSDANALWEPDALRALVAPFADPAVGYVCGQVRFVNDGGHQPGGPLLALRDGAARARVAAGVGDRRQRRDLRDAPRATTSSSTRSWATT